MPLMRRPILTASDFLLASLLGAAASCLALVTGMFLGIGETRIAICFASVTVLIVLYVAVSPAPVAMANLRPLPPSLVHARLLGHPLFADDYAKPEWLSDQDTPEAMTFYEEAERHDACRQDRRDSEAVVPHLAATPGEVIFDQIADALARGQRVELRDFGAFTVKHRAARVGRNPRTGAEVPVDEKTMPIFKAGGELRRRVNPPPWRPEPSNPRRAPPRRQP